MRIISGTARGTKLYTLDGLATRPTLDRVKESVFNIINSQIQESIVLDLFSGSGAIGLEFASRGAKKVFLCDNSKSACEIIKKNIEKTHLNDKVLLFNLDYKKIVEKIKNEKIDIIYLDPPYKTDLIKDSIEDLQKAKLISNKTLIIVETDEKDKIIKQLKNVENIDIIDERKYGRVYVFFLKKNNRKER